MKSEYVKSMENTGSLSEYVKYTSYIHNKLYIIFSVFYKSFVQSLKGDSSNLKKGDQVSQQIEKWIQYILYSGLIKQIIWK